MKKYLIALFTLGVAIAGPAFAYTVQPGDTLWKIAREHNTTVEEIVDINGIGNPDLIFIGQEFQLYDEPFNDLLGATPTPTSSAARKYIEMIDSQLFNGAAAGDTSITLDDLEDIYGNSITMTDVGDLGYGRINPDGTGESISFTGITTNSDGTKTLTGVKTVLAKYPYTQTSGLARSHSIGSLFRLTNTAAFYDEFANKENNEIIDGVWDFDQIPTAVTTTPTLDEHLVTKLYADSLAIAGAPDASTTVKGLVEQATGAEAAANAATGSGNTTAPLTITTNITSSTSSGSGNIVPVTRSSDGRLDSTFCFGAFSCAPTDADGLVTPNPASATTTPATSSVVLYNSNLSVTVTSTPTDNTDATSKLYVDNSFANSVQFLSASTTATSSVDIGTGEVTMYSFTIPGGTLDSNDGLEFEVYLDGYSDDGSGSNTTFRARYGGTAFFTSAFNGSSGSIIMRGTLFNNESTSSQIGAAYIDAPDSTGVSKVRVGGGTASVDSTQNQTLSFTVQAPASTADLDTRSATVKILNVQ